MKQALSAGLIAEGSLCHVRPPHWVNPAGVTVTGRQAACLFVKVASLSNFQALSNLNSINVCLPSPMTHRSPKLFPASLYPQSKSLLLCNKWGGFGPRFIPWVHPFHFALQICWVGNAVLHSLCVQMSTSIKALVCIEFIIVLLMCILPVISQQMCSCSLHIVWQYAWLVCCLGGLMCWFIGVVLTG